MKLQMAYKDDYMFYDDLNSKVQSEDLKFYEKLLKKSKDILEVACGTGRIMSKICKESNYIMGLDNSKEMISIARKKLKDENVEFVLGDMTKLENIDKKFDYIICGYNSLQHVLDNKGVSNFFESARNLLKNDGRIIVDIFNPNPIFLNVEKVHEPKCSFYSEYLNCEVLVEEERIYDPVKKINYIKYIYIKDDKIIVQADAKMRQYYDGEIEQIAENAGLKIEKKFGNYEFEEFSKDSPKQIFVIKKDEKIWKQ